MVETPIQDRTDPEMREIADQVFETLVAQLVSEDAEDA